MTNNFLIIYNKEDIDGLLTGAIFYYYLINKLHIASENISCIGANYEELDNMVKTKEINTIINNYANLILADISFKRVAMLKLYEYYNTKFIWVDNDKLAINDSYVLNYDKTNGLRQHHKSSTLNAYQFLYDVFNLDYNKGETPKIFNILSEYYNDNVVNNDIYKVIIDYINYDFNKAIIFVSNILTKNYETEFINLLRYIYTL